MDPPLNIMKAGHSVSCMMAGVGHHAVGAAQGDARAARGHDVAGLHGAQQQRRPAGQRLERTLRRVQHQGALLPNSVEQKNRYVCAHMSW